jgi:uncharacterized membrane protein required for colicin V production
VVINIFDVFVMIAIAGLAFAGFREGLVRGAIKLVGFVMLVVCIAAVAPHIAAVAGFLPVLSPTISVPLVFALLFVLGIVALHFIAAGLHKLVHMTPAGFLDSGFGAALGILKALIVTGLLALALELAPPETMFHEQYADSATGPYVRRFITDSIPLVKRAAQALGRNASPEVPETPQQDDERPDPGKYL